MPAWLLDSLSDVVRRLRREKTPPLCHGPAGKPAGNTDCGGGHRSGPQPRMKRVLYMPSPPGRGKGVGTARASHAVVARWRRRAGVARTPQATIIAAPKFRESFSCITIPRLERCISHRLTRLLLPASRHDSRHPPGAGAATKLLPATPSSPRASMSVLQRLHTPVQVMHPCIAATTAAMRVFSGPQLPPPPPLKTRPGSLDVPAPGAAASPTPAAGAATSPRPASTWLLRCSSSVSCAALCAMRSAAARIAGRWPPAV